MGPRIDREPAKALSRFGISMRRSNPPSRDRRIKLRIFIIRDSLFREHPDARGVIAGIPSNCAQAPAADLQQFRKRQAVEGFINKAEHLRRIATPHGQTDQTFLSMTCIAYLTIFVK